MSKSIVQNSIFTYILNCSIRDTDISFTDAVEYFSITFDSMVDVFKRSGVSVLFDVTKNHKRIHNKIKNLDSTLTDDYDYDLEEEINVEISEDPLFCLVNDYVNGMVFMSEFFRMSDPNDAPYFEDDLIIHEIYDELLFLLPNLVVSKLSYENSLFDSVSINFRITAKDDVIDTIKSLKHRIAMINLPFKREYMDFLTLTLGQIECEVEDNGIIEKNSFHPDFYMNNIISGNNILHSILPVLAKKAGISDKEIADLVASSFKS